ncbi:ras GEF [Pelomyxa schiedti]|nr:ras GEF [Pelomyxa schiedti]
MVSIRSMSVPSVRLHINTGTAAPSSSFAAVAPTPLPLGGGLAPPPPDALDIGPPAPPPQDCGEIPPPPSFIPPPVGPPPPPGVVVVTPPPPPGSTSTSSAAISSSASGGLFPTATVCIDDLDPALIKQRRRLSTPAQFSSLPRFLSLRHTNSTKMAAMMHEVDAVSAAAEASSLSSAKKAPASPQHLLPNSASSHGGGATALLGVAALAVGGMGLQACSSPGIPEGTPAVSATPPIQSASPSLAPLPPPSQLSVSSTPSGPLPTGRSRSGSCPWVQPVDLSTSSPSAASPHVSALSKEEADEMKYNLSLIPRRVQFHFISLASNVTFPAENIVLGTEPKTGLQRVEQGSLTALFDALCLPSTFNLEQFQATFILSMHYATTSSALFKHLFQKFENPPPVPTGTVSQTEYTTIMRTCILNTCMTWSCMPKEIITKDPQALSLLADFLLHLPSEYEDWGECMKYNLKMELFHHLSTSEVLCNQPSSTEQVNTTAPPSMHKWKPLLLQVTIKKLIEPRCSEWELAHFWMSHEMTTKRSVERTKYLHCFPAMEAQQAAMEKFSINSVHVSELATSLIAKNVLKQCKNEKHSIWALGSHYFFAGFQKKPKKKELDKFPFPKPLHDQKDSTEIEFHDLDPVEVARQLTLIASSLYNSIALYDWFKQAGVKNHSSSMAKFRQFYESVSKWVVIEILKHAHTAKRASVLTHFIHIAACCKAWDNYAICYCIISTLNTNSDFQHDRMWEGLSHHDAETYKDLVSFIDPFHYFKEVAPIFENMNGPCVPDLTMWSSQITQAEEIPLFIEDDNHNKTDRINFVKLTSIAKVLQRVISLQTHQYLFKQVPKIYSYLNTLFANVAASGVHPTPAATTSGSTHEKASSSHFRRRSLNLGHTTPLGSGL